MSTWREKRKRKASLAADPESSSAVIADEPSARPSGLRLWWQRWGWVLRWGGTLAGVAYVLSLIELDGLGVALGRASVGHFLAGLGAAIVGLVLGAVRWRLLLRAYGAVAPPTLGRATRLYFIAVFYNTFFPGGVAGDIVRGVVTRDAFANRGATESLAVVLVERALGLLGVFMLVALGLVLVGDRLVDTGSLWLWSAAGVLGSVAIVIALPVARSVARFLPGRVAQIARRLPAVSEPHLFAWSVLLSLGTQFSVALCGWFLLIDLHPATTVAEALFIVPLAAATVYLPITVGGAGAREAVLITLCARVLGMPSNDALAVSLLLWLATLLSGGFGGILQLWSKKR